MKRSILFLSLLLLPVPAHAITWEEFWRPFTTDEVIIYEEPRPYYYRPRPSCMKEVVREEYVPGYYINKWNYRDGYWRRWTEVVPCGRWR